MTTDYAPSRSTIVRIGVSIAGRGLSDRPVFSPPLRLDEATVASTKIADVGSGTQLAFAIVQSKS
jgi:hypothetical protein